MKRLLLTLAFVAAAAPLAAQQPMAGQSMAGMNMSQATDPMPASYKAVQFAALKEQRRLLLSFADSMPEANYRERVTPPQRTFSEQVQHAAGSAAMIAGGFATATKAQWSFADTAAANGTRAGLKAYINSAYDFAEARLAAQTGADRARTVSLFGSPMMPGWQVFDEINQHTMWTAGQVVANFRMHGGPPPHFGFF
jgi:hypothetical protein